MHYKYYVLVKSTDAQTSEEARDKATSILENNMFVAPENGGYFCNSKSDWFVIGGRWSGDLSALIHYPEFYADVQKQFAKNSSFGLTTDELEKHKSEIQSLWETKAPKGLLNPLARDNYNDRGGEDDAMKLTPELIDVLEKEAKHNEHMEIFLEDIYEEKTLRDFLDSFEPDENGGDWLVVVDYHN